MVQNKAEIASKSMYNPRASRALERALDPGRKGLRASRTYSPPLRTVLALSGCTGVLSGPSEKKFENPWYRESKENDFIKLSCYYLKNYYFTTFYPPSNMARSDPPPPPPTTPVY